MYNKLSVGYFELKLHKLLRTALRQEGWGSKPSIYWTW